MKRIRAIQNLDFEEETAQLEQFAAQHNPQNAQAQPVTETESKKDEVDYNKFVF